MAETILTLVRHGETPANTERVWHGSTDTPLSERGLRQAQRVAEHLRETLAAAVYSSPLRRALDTARVIGAALGLEPRIDRDLSEYHLGVWEGRSYRELYRVENFWTRIAADPDFAPEGGESVRQVATRFAAALERIAAAHPGERPIVVAHGGALTLALGWILDGNLASWRRVMNNCAVSELVLGPEPRLRRFNDSSHLEGLEPIDPRALGAASDDR